MLTGSPKLLPRGYHELSVNFQTDEVTHVKKEALFDQLERLSDCLLVTPLTWQITRLVNIHGNLQLMFQR